tara:strand:- start:26558 stop:27298 length:741 start_codon:yes stop_codon:yes gene_type:complete
MSDADESDDLPLPPLPPGISLPPPPPPPPLPEFDEDADGDEGEDIYDSEAHDDATNENSSFDFKSQWENRKANDPTLTSDSKDSMYGHIDRIATGEVGTLLDRFSDRFGSELDREIIVLRKKQQQEIRAVKPTVELISAPESDDVDVEVDDESVDADDEFTQFFDVVNKLLGDMPDDFIQRFLSSESFKLFETVGANPTDADEETRLQFFTMINAELGELPEDKINKFVESPGFELFTKMGELYGG